MTQGHLGLGAPTPFEALAIRHYRCIHADPPWPFDNYSALGEKKNPKRHYKTMSLAQIANLPVRALADHDCMLFLWAVRPLLDKAFMVIAAWGFEYKSVAFTWVKTTSSGKFPIGTGYYTRGNPETCLLATIGTPPVLAHDVPELIFAHRREHSRKPDEAFRQIERLTVGPRVDLFSRQQRAGWDVWGDEVDKFQEAA